MNLHDAVSKLLDHIFTTKVVEVRKHTSKSWFAIDITIKLLVTNGHFDVEK